jgi:CRISPR-associated protein Cas1
VQWTGEEGVRFYAQGMGETRSARALLRQAQLVSEPASRLQVVRRMYEMRFSEPVDAGMSLQQLRGMEGARVRAAYRKASCETGVPWAGRSYQRNAWAKADPVNRALSAANSCLYGICHAAIVAAGYSPGLGFIHTGKGLSFVYDVADLYKAEITVPIAFRFANNGSGLETTVRHACRDAFREQRLLQRLVPDLDRMMSVGGAGVSVEEENPFADDEAAPGGLWDPEGEVEGGLNRGGDEPDGGE